MKKLVVNSLYGSYEIKKEIFSVLDNISIYANENEFISIIGPSGCGKSTLFRYLSGLEHTYQGEIDIKGKISLMHQNHNLMPWRTVYNNIILPYEIKGKSFDRSIVESLAAEFGIKEFLDMYPHHLSGGMKKRASLLRTYLSESDIMLLDEPFGSLDAITRKSMYEWLLDIWHKYQKTVLFITHDIEEAIYLSDRIYVMSQIPAQIVKEVKIEFSRPRSRDMLYTDKFLEYKKMLENALNN